MKAGDVVRVVKIPSGLPSESQEVFERCLGKRFPIAALEDDGRVELLVGEVVGEVDHLHSIYLWPDEVEPEEGSE